MLPLDRLELAAFFDRFLIAPGRRDVCCAANVEGNMYIRWAAAAFDPSRSRGASAAAARVEQGDVLQATLRNGLVVVIVHNTLAPVASTDLSLVKLARRSGRRVRSARQEHMMFRGTKNLSTSELGTIATALGGDFNAQTSAMTTQYQFTVPASDLDAVLRIESDRMRGVLDLQSQWQNERGAIEQEVARDEAAPGSDFFTDAQAIAYKGTVYEHLVSGPGLVRRVDGSALSVLAKWYAQQCRARDRR